mgnify:FL=1
MNKGLLLVLSGPAGSGKGTVKEFLLQKEPFEFSVSKTTRAPRPGEVDGKQYSFVTREAFENLIREDGMLEYTEYCGNFYGTPKKESLETLAAGKNLLLEIDAVGGLNVKSRYPDAVLVMLLAPSFAEQEARLRGRATETEEKIRERLAAARREIEMAREYDYIVYNPSGKAEAAADEICTIIRAARLAVSRNTDFAERYFEK